MKGVVAGQKGKDGCSRRTDASGFCSNIEYELWNADDFIDAGAKRSRSGLICVCLLYHMLKVCQMVHE